MFEGVYLNEDILLLFLKLCYMDVSSMVLGGSIV